MNYGWPELLVFDSNTWNQLEYLTIIITYDK